jgi:hypothetical protein
VVLQWFRSRARKREEPAGTSCTGCLASLTGSTSEQLGAAGAVFMEAVGWFCGHRCERQYRFRFRVRSAEEAAMPVAVAAVPTPPPPDASQMTVEELMEKLRERRRRLGHR